jgi:outer membrane protein assembly factor BamB
MMNPSGSRWMIALVLWPAVSGLAMDWPQWRGPFFNGSTDADGLPASWSKEGGIAWVSPLPGPSGATPVLAGGRVFVTSMVKGTPEFVALCFDAADGKPLWKRQVGSDNRRFPRNNMASPSPVTDGKRVFFLYGDGTLVGFDIEGKELWSRDLEKEYGNLALQFGYSSSPLLYDGRLYVVVFRRDTPYRGQDPGVPGPLDSFVLAVDPATGQNLWKQTRKTDAFDEGMETYMTAIPFVRDGKAELLTTGGDFVTSHDPKTGEELWRFEYWKDKVRDSRVIPTLVTGDGLIFGARHKHKGVFALEPPARNGRGGRILWEFDEAAPDCSTPLFYDGRLYVLDGLKRKVVTCFEPRTGKQFWQGRMPGSRPWWASLTAGDGKLYCIDEDGHVVVLQAGGSEFKILFETTIDEPDIQSSIAIADNRLFLRTAENLYCITR